MISLALAVLAMAGVVFLTFGYSASLKLIRELEEKVNNPDGASKRRRLGYFAGPNFTFALIGQAGCSACVDRSSDLARLVALGTGVPVNLSFTILQAEGENSAVKLPAEVTFQKDPALVGRLDVGIFPTGLVFDPEGNEVARSVLGDRISIEKLFNWACKTATSAHDEFAGTQRS